MVALQLALWSLDRAITRRNHITMLVATTLLGPLLARLVLQ